VPQVPQLFASCEVSVQTPEHAVCPPAQEQAPFAHDCPAPQAVVQVPQWALSVCASTQAPSQLVSELKHAHWLLEQDIPEAHVVPQVPQLALLAVRSAQVPEQSVWPVGQPGAPPAPMPPDPPVPVPESGSVRDGPVEAAWLQAADQDAARNAKARQYLGMESSETRWLRQNLWASQHERMNCCDRRAREANSTGAGRHSAQGVSLPVKSNDLALAETRVTWDS
jgi:hypothetical protein